MFKFIFTWLMITLFSVIFGLFFLLVSISASAEERVVQKDERGNKLYHKQQYVATQGQMCPISVTGYREWHKPCITISKEIFEKITKESK